MKRLVLILTSLITIPCFAQQGLEPTTNTTTKPKSTIIKSPNNSDTQMKRLATEDKISADNAFKMGDYNLALALYLDELSKKPEDNDIRVKIGQCYLETDIKKSNAIEYFEYAASHGYKNNLILLYQGKAYQYAERFDDAISKFNEYKTLESKKQENIAIVEKLIADCNIAKQLKSHPVNVTIQNMGDIINSTKSDNMPIVAPDESSIIINSNRFFSQDYGEYLWDVLISENKNNKWKKAHSISTKINTLENEYIVGSSPDLESILIRPETYTNSGNLSISQSINKKYEIPVILPETINSTKDIETAGCLSANGDTLFFSSNRAGGFGGFDIYYSIKIGNSWGIPQNMGSSINTPKDDDYPNIMSDGKTFYFASEGYNGMGGFDIYKSTLNTQTHEWNKPQNIGYPLNTTYDDYNISFTINPRYAYVAQVKDEGMGEYDIYRIIFNDVEAPLITYTGRIAVGDTATAKPLMEVSPKNTIKVFEKKTGTLIGQYTMNKESHYAISLFPGNYSLEIEAEGIEKFKKTIIITDKQPENSVVINDIYIKQ